MNKTLMIQLTLLALALLVMLAGILLQKPLVAEQDPKLELMIMEYGDDPGLENEDGQRLVTGEENGLNPDSSGSLNQTETSF